MRAVFIAPDESNVGFEPVMWLRTQEMIRALGRRGVEVHPMSLRAFADSCRGASTELARVDPDFITAPNFNYFLVAANDEGRLPRALDKPIVALWDDPLGALANCMRHEESRGPTGLLGRVLRRVERRDPTGIAAAVTGTLTERAGRRVRMFTQVMDHPLLRHFSWDSGHVEAVESLGLLKPGRVRWYPIATYRPFLEAGTRAAGCPQTRDVAFCGNVYLGTLAEHPMWQNELLRSLTTRICERKLHELDRPVWSFMMEEIGALPPAVRDAHGLHVQSRPFWDYYLFAVWHAANTLVRLAILGGIKREVNLFGLFADPKSVARLHEYPNLRYQGNVHHFEELPSVYASTRINVCVTNGLVYRGMSSKLIDCLASGGFALTDPKRDVLEFFGPTAERIFFRDIDELNAKIEHYLAHPDEREEITQILGEKIRRHCTLDALFDRVLQALG
jgi:Glycosyl transferases group 1